MDSSAQKLPLRGEADKSARVALAQKAELFIGLVGYMHTCWNAARDAKQPMRDIMLRALRQRGGDYEAGKKAHISQFGGSDAYIRITDVKCRGATSWISDILLDTGTLPFDIKPTPIPELPPEVMAEMEQAFGESVLSLFQSGVLAPTGAEMRTYEEAFKQEWRKIIDGEAMNRAMLMKRKIADQFVEGKFGRAMEEFIDDLVTFPCAFIKGPIVRRTKKLGYVKDPNGKTVVDVTEELSPQFERIDPFRMYPQPGIENIEDGYIFEHHKMSSEDLSGMRGIAGFDTETIEVILAEGPSTSWLLETYDYEKEQAQRQHNAWNYVTDTYDVLEWWGELSGKMLLEWGLSDSAVPDPAAHYSANVWMCGHRIIKVMLNQDPLGEKPYVKTSFYKQPGSFWGKSIPEVIAAAQDGANASNRNLVNNAAISSAPQVEVNMERIPLKQNITKMVPWGIWQVTGSPFAANDPAIRFTQPDSRVKELMEMFEFYSKMADDLSGIPAHLNGDIAAAGGAGRTASGLSMLLGASGKMIQNVIMHIDSDIIKPMVTRQHIYNMRYDPNEDIKGDVQIMALGAKNLSVREQDNVRRLDFLNVLQNPVFLQIMGKKGVATVLRSVAKGLKIDPETVVPTDEEMKLDETLQNAAQPQQDTSTTNTHPDGSEKGGSAGDTVSSNARGR